MNVTCNEGCQKEFKITEIKTDLVEKLPGNVERFYFACPNCAQVYTSYFLDDSMKEMQQEIRELKSKQNLKIKQKNRLMTLTRKLAAMNERHKKAYREATENHG
ncbi:hypothetical protein AB685_28395 [Bacillus sp. LL01]|uniref:hypothetical protein n=1 Tax=Bacillus sp. LL01 TaxID=1665556 RepID=UPI00064D01E0|nr:hypothetical protein [Bacillus sp. LL01]KMJ55221.1 hypothetical protein AB685_28395 [Bacillus sp. LL01]